MKADTPQRYAPFTRFLHWGMAACYAFMFTSASGRVDIQHFGGFCARKRHLPR